VTGVTTFFMDEGVDTGDIIMSRATDIGLDETAGELLERLSTLGADLVRDTCDLVESGSAKPFKQNQIQASYAPRLSKQDGKIVWDREARAVHNHVRGMSPWPGTFCFFREQALKILSTGLGGQERSPLESNMNGVEPGTVIAIDSAGGILVSCGSGSVWLVTLQAQGKRATAGADFARGHRIKVGDHFG
jgi:methionyl-tRNA formyltransferase